MKLHSLKHTCIIPVLCAALLIPSYTVHADWDYNAEENTLRYKTKDGTYLTSVFRKIKGYTYYFDADRMAGFKRRSLLLLGERCHADKPVDR